MVFRTLSGRFLLLTLVFVLLTEIMILVPSLARFRVEFLQDRLERSQMASLALLTTPSVMIDETLEAELLANAGVLNVALKRDHTRELFLSTPGLGPIEGMYDMRESSWPQLIWDAMKVLWTDEARNIRVVGEPVRNAGEMIDVVMDESTLRVAMLEYGRNILLLSAVISIATSILLFLAVQYLMVRPINRLTRGMLRYAAQPEDASRVIQPRDGGTELHDAERALQSMQTQLTESLAHKERLANLGQGRLRHQSRPAWNSLDCDVAGRSAQGQLGPRCHPERATSHSFALACREVLRNDASVREGQGTSSPAS